MSSRAPSRRSCRWQWATTDEQKAGVKAAYSAQISSIKNGKFVIAWKARHFVMLDDPTFFFRNLDEFLKENHK